MMSRGGTESELRFARLHHISLMLWSQPSSASASIMPASLWARVCPRAVLEAHHHTPASTLCRFSSPVTTSAFHGGLPNPSPMHTLSS